MIFHAEKSKIVNFYGDFPEYILNSASVEIVSSHKDLGLTMTHNLNRSLHISTRLQKTYNIFFFDRRDVCGAISLKTKLYLCKSTIFNTLCYASPCWFASRGDMRKIEKLQRRVTERVLPWRSDYRERLIFLNLLPIPMYFQVLEVLTLVKICNGGYNIDPHFTFKLGRASFCDCRIIPHIEYPSSELQ